jgi:hypothetical protein
MYGHSDKGLNGIGQPNVVTIGCSSPNNRFNLYMALKLLNELNTTKHLSALVVSVT